jgi:hypothetical protein
VEFDAVRLVKGRLSFCSAPISFAITKPCWHNWISIKYTGSVTSSRWLYVSAGSGIRSIVIEISDVQISNALHRTKRLVLRLITGLPDLLDGEGAVLFGLKLFEGSGPTRDGEKVLLVFFTQYVSSPPTTRQSRWLVHSTLP